MPIDINFFLNNINYIGAMTLFVIGLYTVLTHPNLIKKVIGINIMETAVFLFFVSIGFISGANAPIVERGQATEMVVNPLPSALILTGIVVAIGVTAFALSLVVKIHQFYGTIELDEIMQIRSVEKS